jgi:hypothetical protein
LLCWVGVHFGIYKGSYTVSTYIIQNVFFFFKSVLWFKFGFRLDRQALYHLNYSTSFSKYLAV